MTTQTQPYDQPQQQPAPKKKHTVRNVFLAVVLVFVLFVGGCLALIGGAANEIDKSIKENDNRAGGANNALTISEGKAFEVAGFNYAAGWSLTKEFGGYLGIKGLKVTNNREDKDGALVEIKLMKGSEVVALADCTTEQIPVGQTTSVDCSSADKMPRTFDRITINDTF